MSLDSTRTTSAILDHVINPQAIMSDAEFWLAAAELYPDLAENIDEVRARRAANKARRKVFTLVPPSDEQKTKLCPDGNLYTAKEDVEGEDVTELEEEVAEGEDVTELEEEVAEGEDVAEVEEVDDDFFVHIEVVEDNTAELSGAGNRLEGTGTGELVIEDAHDITFDDPESLEHTG